VYLILLTANFYETIVTIDGGGFISINFKI
jgi:hypothetical protein